MTTAQTHRGRRAKSATTRAKALAAIAVAVDEAAFVGSPKELALREAAEHVIHAIEAAGLRVVERKARP